MKTVKIGEKDINLRATPLGLFYYKQEFGTDLMGDLMKMCMGLVGTGLLELSDSINDKGEIDITKIDLDKINPETIALGLDTVMFLKLIWTMAKTAEGPGKSFPGFEKWLDTLDGFNLMEPGFIGTVMTEAMDGFFRGAAARAELAAKQGKPAK